MEERSKRHHENPKWLLKHFSSGCDAMLWVGFKNSREVKFLNAKVVFTRY